MKNIVLLPAFNEEKSIAWLVEKIKKLGFEVLVVDDGSTDKTSAEAKKAQANVIVHEKNLGKGQALRTGFEFAKKNNYDAVIIMDADGQHCPEDLEKFVRKAEGSRAGIIVGNRMDDPQGMPFVRKLTNIVTSATVSRLTGYKIPDTQCGFRLVRTDVLRQIKLSTFNYETESEMLIEAARNDFSIESVPVKTIYADQKSQISPLKDTIRFWSLIFKNIFRKK